MAKTPALGCRCVGQSQRLAIDLALHQLSYQGTLPLDGAKMSSSDCAHQLIPEALTACREFGFATRCIKMATLPLVASRLPGMPARKAAQSCVLGGGFELGCRRPS